MGNPFIVVGWVFTVLAGVTVVARRSIVFGFVGLFFVAVVWIVVGLATLVMGALT